MRTNVEFCSTDFSAYPDNVETTNTGRFGKRLAEYLSASLPQMGFEIDGIRSEDWGWIVQIKNDNFPLWIGCGNYDDLENGFLCFIEPSRPIVRRWFKKYDTSHIVECLAQAVEHVLVNKPGVSNLRWWEDNKGDM